MKILDLPVEFREKLGSANARRYRRAGRVPVILYGGDRPNVTLTTAEEDILRVVDKHSMLVKLKVEDKTQTALVREVEWDVFSEHIAHVDLARVEMEDEVTVNVPVQIHGVPAGASEGGTVEVVLNEITVVSRVDSLPEEFVIDVSALHIGQGVHIDEMEFPEHVSSTRRGRDLVVHIVPPKKIEVETPEGEDADLGLAAAEAPEPAADAAEES